MVNSFTLCSIPHSTRWTISNMWHVRPRIFLPPPPQLFFGRQNRSTPNTPYYSSITLRRRQNSSRFSHSFHFRPIAWTTPIRRDACGGWITKTSLSSRVSRISQLEGARLLSSRTSTTASPTATAKPPSQNVSTKPPLKMTTSTTTNRKKSKPAPLLPPKDSTAKISSTGTTNIQPKKSTTRKAKSPTLSPSVPTTTLAATVATSNSKTALLQKSFAPPTTNSTLIDSKPKPKNSKSKITTTHTPNTTKLTTTKMTTTSNDNRHSNINSSNNIPADPRIQLDQLQKLVDLLLATNSHLEKKEILRQHAHLAPILGIIYDPQRVFRVTSESVIKYMETKILKEQTGGKPIAAISSSEKKTKKQQKQEDDLGIQVGTLEDLLLVLSNKKVSGNAAKGTIASFIQRFCCDSNVLRENWQKSPKSELLLRVLDKNLKTSCSVGMLREVYPNLVPEFKVALGHSLESIEDARKLFVEEVSDDTDKEKQTPKSQQQPLLQLKRLQDYFKPESLKPSPSTTSSTITWLASRKLDGVRCLIHIDRQSRQVTTFSRTGREFDGLDEIQQALKSLTGLGRAADDAAGGVNEFFKRAMKLDTTESLPDGIMLDGELCVFEPEEVDATSATTPRVESNLGKENFIKTVGLVKRQGGATEKRAIKVSAEAIAKFNEEHDDGDDFNSSRSNSSEDYDDNIENSDSLEPIDSSLKDKLSYHIFDCLTDTEFQFKTASRPFADRILGIDQALQWGRTWFQDRHDQIQPLVSSLSQHDFHSCIQVLDQFPIVYFSQLSSFVESGMFAHWEGVMLRKNTGYNGKRSRDLLKIKQFQEAEFVVQQVQLSRMRVPWKGKYKERKVLANIVVFHKGNPVSVGSGFSVKDRIRFAKDPTLILGKMVTVQYFAESVSSTTTLTSTRTTNNNQQSELSRPQQTLTCASTAPSSPSPSLLASLASTNLVSSDHSQPSLDPDHGAEKEVISFRDSCTDNSHGPDRSHLTVAAESGSDQQWVTSLRFPTIKAIYETGTRNI